jgi:hypothetical protein
VEKYGTAGQATDDNTTGRTPIACWITKVTDTNSEYGILIAATETIVTQKRPHVTFPHTQPAFLRNYLLNLSGSYVYHVLHDSQSVHIYHVFVIKSACSALKLH